MSARPSLNVLSTAALLWEESERRIEGRVAALAEGKSVSCHAGCFACCHQLVVVSPLEAHAIAGYLDEHPELQEAAQHRLEEWEAQVSETPALKEALEAFSAADGYLSGEAGGALEEAYWQAHLPCPFLAEGLCSIYPARPFACREHLVVSDPVLCAENPDAAVPAGTHMEFRAVANWVGARAFFLADRLIPLPRALEYTRERGEEARREAPGEQVLQEAEAGQRRARLALARLLYRR
jgi:Fe-S-cluster containining protein